MKRSACLFAILCGLSFFSLAQRQKLSLDRNWQFHFGHAAIAEKDFNYGIANSFSKSGAAVKTAIDPKFDDSQWRKLDLPGTSVCI